LKVAKSHLRQFKTAYNYAQNDTKLKQSLFNINGGQKITK